MNWYGPSITTPPDQHVGYGVFEIPRDPNDPIRVLLRAGNVPFTTIQDAQNYLQTLHPDPRVLYTVARIIETNTP